MPLALLGEEQRVPSTQRADVEEGEDVLILVDLVAGDLTGDDLVEDGFLVVAHGGIVQEETERRRDEETEGGGGSRI
jgi:hypothetical protein